MSASQQTGKNRPVATDDEWPDRDAYAIDIPDAFKEAYPEADSVLDALALAEQAAAAGDDETYVYEDLTHPDPAAVTTVTTDADSGEQARCLRCNSCRLSPKGNDTQSTKKTDGYVCDNCRTHQSDPEHPEHSEIEFSDGQTQLGRWADE